MKNTNIAASNTQMVSTAFIENPAEDSSETAVATSETTSSCAMTAPDDNKATRNKQNGTILFIYLLMRFIFSTF
jgi:hypothetical protein